MANDPTIRNLFPVDDAPLKGLDAASVIRRSRARRLPKQLGAGSIFTLAIGGLVIASVQGLGSFNSNPPSAISAQEKTVPSSPSAAAEDSDRGTPFSADSGASESSPGSDPSSDLATLKRASATDLNVCGQPLSNYSEDGFGIELSLSFPESANVNDRSIVGSAIALNQTSQRLDGTSFRDPTLVLSRDGVVVWHSITVDRNEIFTPSEIPPGDSYRFDFDIAPDDCSTEGDGALYSSDDLPPLDPGEYQLSAVVDYFSGDQAHLVSSPLTTITLK